MKPTIKERHQQNIFLKNFGLRPIKNQRYMEEKNDINFCEQICFYYFDNDGRVICRGCYKKFKTWFNFRLHFNTLSCNTTQTNYKLNTYNDVYKKYKLKKAKTKKRKNYHSSAELMDLETLNTRKTRNRCYQNTTIVTVDKSSSDSGSINSKKATVKTLKKEVIEIYTSSDENVEDSNTKPNGRNTIKVQDIPNSTNTIFLKSPNDNQMMLTVRTKRNADDLSHVSSDNHPSSSSHISSKYNKKK